MKKLSQNVFFLIVIALFCISNVWAQENAPSQPPDLELTCITRDKGYTVHFTAYQPEAAKKEGDKEPGAKFKRFCHDLPIVGATYITIDLVDNYTRRRAVAFRIVEATAGEDPGTIVEKRTLVKVPEKHYDTGLVETKLNFDKPGLYAAILTIGGEDVTIPIQVGVKKETPVARRIIVAALVILILIAIGYAAYRFRFLSAVKVKDKGDKESNKEDQEDKVNKEENNKEEEKEKKDEADS